MGFKISLAGDLGSGKSTVSKILIDKTGAQYYSTGTICRREAAKHGMTIDEFNRYMESHPEVDKMIDDSLVALSDDPATLIIDSRMAFHFVKGTYRIYLTTDPRVSAERILSDKRAGESFGTVEETANRVSARRKSENLRYFEKYGVHIMDMQNYDLVLDTTAITPDEVAELILANLAAWLAGHRDRRCYLDYRRFMTKTPPPPDAAAHVRDVLDRGEGFPAPTVQELGGAYYLTGGCEGVLAARELEARVVPARLVPGKPNDPNDYRPLYED